MFKLDAIRGDDGYDDGGNVDPIPAGPLLQA